MSFKSLKTASAAMRWFLKILENKAGPSGFRFSETESGSYFISVAATVFKLNRLVASKIWYVEFFMVWQRHLVYVIHPVSL
jgi:hypothetical protein